MNRNIALALTLACAAVGAAYADDITVDPHTFVSTTTRAQVLQELRQFQKSGVNPWADEYNQIPTARSTLTRAEVMADFQASRNMVAAFSAEDSGSSYMTRLAAAKPRSSSTELAQAE